MEFLTIYVLTRGRQKYLLEMLDSLNDQCDKEFKLIVSDNTEIRNKKDQTDIQVSFNDIKESFYLKRSGYLSIMEHFQLCVNECDTNYIVLLHDDDILENDYVGWIKNICRNNPDFTAICPSCNHIDDSGINFGQFQSELKEQVFQDVDTLVLTYLNFFNKNYPATPFFIFKTKELKNVINDLESGYYFDLELYIRLISKGFKIARFPAIKASIRTHQNNNSKLYPIEDINKIIELIQFYCKFKTYKLFIAKMYSIIIINNIKIFVKGGEYQKGLRYEMKSDPIISIYVLIYIMGSFYLRLKKYVRSQNEQKKYT
jgi:hypothetical protein